MSFEERLIAMVQANEILFNLQHRGYRRVNEKERVWQQIAYELNSTVSQCKKRWKGLRDTYKRHRRGEALSTDITTDQSNRRRWRYYEALSFLDAYSEPRSNISNTKENNVAKMVGGGGGDYSMVEFFAPPPNFAPPAAICATNSRMVNTTTVPNKARGDEVNIQKTFCTYLETVANGEFGVPPPGPKTSTETVFAALAMKITEANLPLAVKNDLEARIFRDVYETIARYQK